MPLGWHNPVPLEIGGSPTEVDKAQQALLDAIGIGGATADQEDSIDGAWRAAVAEGIATLGGYGEHALCQGFPHLSTDHVPVFESLLGQVEEPGESLEDRRQETTAAYTVRAGADLPTLRAALFEIDSRLDVLLPAWAATDTTLFGRSFGDAAETYGAGWSGSNWPNYSGEFRLYVLFDTGSVDPLTPEEEFIVLEVKDLLRRALPSVFDFAVITSVGFLAGTSPLGYTGGGA